MGLNRRQPLAQAPAEPPPTVKYVAQVGATMGEVLLKYRITPDGETADLAAIEKGVRAAIPATIGKVNKAEIQPFVFGMKVLVASFIVQDEEGNNDKVEQAILAVPGVGGADLLDMGRLM